MEVAVRKEFLEMKRKNKSSQKQQTNKTPIAKENLEKLEKIIVDNKQDETFLTYLVNLFFHRRSFLLEGAINTHYLRNVENIINKKTELPAYFKEGQDLLLKAGGNKRRNDFDAVYEIFEKHQIIEHQLVDN